MYQIQVRNRRIWQPQKHLHVGIPRKLYYKHDGIFGSANNFEHKEDGFLNSLQLLKMFEKIMMSIFEVNKCTRKICHSTKDRVIR